MLTDPAKYGDARGATPDRLRTAAWLQYLIEHLDGAACAGDPVVVPSHAIHVGAGASLSREAGPCFTGWSRGSRRTAAVARAIRPIRPAHARTCLPRSNSRKPNVAVRARVPYSTPRTA